MSGSEMHAMSFLPTITRNGKIYSKTLYLNNLNMIFIEDY